MNQDAIRNYESSVANGAEPKVMNFMFGNYVFRTCSPGLSVCSRYKIGCFFKSPAVSLSLCFFVAPGTLQFRANASAVTAPS